MNSRPEVDLALALLRSASGAVAGAHAAPVELPDSVDRIDWQKFVRLTSAHFILPAIAPPLAAMAAKVDIPSDLLEFVAEMRASNESRNRELGTALGKISACLAEAGIPAIALKGAAFLAEDEAGAAGWRFMNDLDVLIRPDHLAQAVASLATLGFVPEHDHYDPSREAHYPPLIAPGRRFSVEIHTRLFGRDDFGIDVERLRRQSITRQAWGATLRIPSPIDRVAHTVAHAQLHNRQFAARRIVLKDVLDLEALPQAAKSAYRAPAGDRHPVDRFGKVAAEALFVAAEHLLEREALAHARSNATIGYSRAQRWADRALARLHWSEMRTKLATPADLARIEATRWLREPGHFADRCELIASPRRRAGALSRFAWKQRQRLWS